MNEQQPTGATYMDHENNETLVLFNLTLFDTGRYIVVTTPRHRAGWAAYMAARSVSSP